MSEKAVAMRLRFFRAGVGAGVTGGGAGTDAGAGAAGSVSAAAAASGFSSATGTRVKFINLASAVIIAVVIVLAMNLVGSLLISALVVFPALSAMRVFKSFRSVTICSAALSAGCTLTGLAIAVTADTPVGATIVATQAIVFLIFLVIGKIKG